MATIYDIAKICNVSTATVSRVLNDSDHPVHPNTKSKILKAAKELNYRPNSIAKSLASGRTQTIALLVPTISNDYYTQIAESMENELNNAGYIAYLCNTKRSVLRETEYVENLIIRRVDGVIFSPTRVKPEDNVKNLENIEELKRNNIAVVAFGSRFEGVSQVSVDTYKGAYEATKYLISLGHRRIGFIDGLTAGTQGNRRKGYMDALKNSDIDVDNDLIIRGNLDIDSGYKSGFKLLNQSEPPTAIFAVNNLMSIGVLNAAKDMHIKVPNELSVIGFDDSILSKLVEPSLTVVRQPLDRMGAIAVKLLLDELNGIGEIQSVELEPILVERNSCFKVI
ncbi:MAG TPA: LacI family transcriptional regulator [Clostridiales bacterium]|nr:LacI family transcriptional regulator [Clostridiales bacterium]